MIDRNTGDFGPLLRSPDLHFDGVENRIVTLERGGAVSFDLKGRAMLCFARSGLIRLRADTDVDIVRGAAIGRERVDRLTVLAPDGAAELFLSSIPRRLALIRRLPEGEISIAPDAGSAAAMLRAMVDAVANEMALPDPDLGVIRRLCEVMMLQLVRHLRDGRGVPPVAIRHDEHLLRAWAAFFADPQGRWTVGALAGASGLSESACAERFRRAFDAPPMKVLTRLRMERAQTMLRSSSAPLRDVAQAVGYRSEAAFLRAFRRVHGVTPGDLRRQSRAAATTARAGPGRVDGRG